MNFIIISDKDVGNITLNKSLNDVDVALWVAVVLFHPTTLHDRNTDITCGKTNTGDRIALVVLLSVLAITSAVVLLIVANLIKEIEELKAARLAKEQKRDELTKRTKQLQQSATGKAPAIKHNGTRLDENVE